VKLLSVAAKLNAVPTTKQYYHVEKGLAAKEYYHK
jgi:hypothetical protein